MISIQALLVLASLAFHAGCSKPASPPPVIAELPAPSLIDQNGTTFDGATMQEKLWVVSFVFTHCRSTCPRIMAEMKKLQARVIDAPCVQFLSVSVDPLNDTPKVIKTYMTGNRLDERNWKFVTGSERAVEDFVVSGFKVGYGRTPVSPELTHSNSLALVDERGRVRGYYATNAEEMAALERDLRALASDLPSGSCRSD